MNLTPDVSVVLSVRNGGTDLPKAIANHPRRRALSISR